MALFFITMSKGWIKLHRQITEWEWYDDANTFRLFMHLILNANHKEKQWHGITIKSNQQVTSREKLAKSLRLSVQQIRTSLDHLKSTNEITIKTTNKYSLISINKWERYQITTNKSTNEQPTTNHQPTTNKNVKNEKNKKGSISFNRFWDVYPRKVAKQKALASWNKINPNSELLEIILGSIKSNIKSGQWNDLKFIPHPTTWLNGARWEDEPLKKSQHKNEWYCEDHKHWIPNKMTCGYK